MSRFVDLNATRRVELGPCQCPNQNHPDGDWVEVAERWSGIDLIALSDAQDNETRVLRLVNRGTRAWNFLDEDDQPVPLTPPNIAALDTPTLQAIAEGINSAFEELALPNASGARSQATRRANGSRTRKATKTS